MQWKRQRVCSPLRRREGGRRDGPARLAASGPDAVGPVEEELVLPIFPLGLVALPYGVVPLHIFEARYRVLFSTLLHGESDIDEDLVQPESPFLASRRFGISCIFSRSEEDSTSSSTIASVGTIMNITKHEQLQDGQMDILCEGAHRFKILEVIEEKPVLLCRYVAQTRKLPYRNFD